MPFRVSQRALAKVKEFMLLVPEHERYSEYIPAVVWATGGHEPDFKPGPIIGGYERENVPKDCILTVDDMELAFSLETEVLDGIKGKTLDYQDGRFVFI